MALDRKGANERSPGRGTTGSEISSFKQNGARVLARMALVVCAWAGGLRKSTPLKKLTVGLQANMHVRLRRVRDRVPTEISSSAGKVLFQIYVREHSRI